MNDAAARDEFMRVQGPDGKAFVVYTDLGQALAALVHGGVLPANW